MNINLNSTDREKYYQLAIDCFQNIDPKVYENSMFEIVSKSISILIDHDFIPTPCVEIKLELLKDQKKTGNYFLYVDKNKEFIDELLVT